MDDIQDIINLGEQGNIEEKLAKFEATQKTMASNLAKFQEIKDEKAALTAQIAQLDTYLQIQPDSPERQASKIQSGFLRNRLDQLEAEEDALRGNVELSTTQVDASTVFENKKQVVQDEINTLKERLAKSVVPPGADMAKQAAVAVEQRTLKARLQLAEKRLVDIEDEITSLSKPSEPKSNPLLEKRAAIAQQLEDAKTELSKFPARGGNVSRKSKLKNNIIPDLEQQLAEVDKALQANQ
jgi:predicted  nucleic acid-binding Zn-ribbon protein